MPIPLRSRRRQVRKASSVQQILVFSLQQHWFALPVPLVYKVIAVDVLHRAENRGLPGLVLYQNQEIPVIDIQQRIFGATFDHTTSGFLVLVQNMQGEVVGLPLTSQPNLRRIPESAIAPLSSTYLAEGAIRCVIAMAISGQDEAPIFFLDLGQLLQRAAALPAG
jgi:chemotaxis signal transduction protein